MIPTIEEQILIDIETQQQAGGEARAYAVTNAPRHVGFWDGWTERGKAILSAMEGEAGNGLSRLIPEATRAHEAAMREEIRALKREVSDLKQELSETRVDAKYQRARRLLAAGCAVSVSVASDGKVKRDIMKGESDYWEPMNIPGYLFDRLSKEGYILETVDAVRCWDGSPRKHVIDALASSVRPLRTADLTGRYTYNTIRATLVELMKSGDIRRVKRGYYALRESRRAAA